MPIQQSLNMILTNPVPGALWQLRKDTLEAGMSNEAPGVVVLDEFYQFLTKLVASSTAREFSHFASILDMAAIGGVSVQNLMQEEKDEKWWQRFLTGIVSESMMVLAARQYVKAWEEEMKATYDAAAYCLWIEYWHLSAGLHPDLPADQRRQLVGQLVAPLGDENTGGVVKAGLIVRLFQLLLLFHMQPFLR